MKLSHLYILLGFIILSFPLAAQETLYSEISLKWNFDPNPEDRWSYNFGSQYRSSFYRSGKFDYNTSFLQLNVAPSFAINSNHAISLDLRYRIKEFFHSQLTDEKRVTQQYNHSHQLNKLNIQDRFRVEQRFRKNFSLRNRYRLGATFALNSNPDVLKKWFLTTNTEFLWKIFPQRRPRFDQRFSVVLEKPISTGFTFKLQTQYRYIDMMHQGREAWRFYASFDISL